MGFISQNWNMLCSYYYVCQTLHLYSVPGLDLMIRGAMQLSEIGVIYCINDFLHYINTGLINFPSSQT